MIKRIIVIAALVVGLASCSSKINTEEHDGRTCMVARDYAGEVVSIDCKWTDG